MSQPQALTFRMTIEQTNLVLTALGQQPYVQVAGLITQLQQQAKTQLEQPDPGQQVLQAFAGMGAASPATTATSDDVIEHAG